MGLFLGIAVFVFASVVWHVERGSWESDLHCYVNYPADDCSLCGTMFDCFYWILTTMTTVGYGDVVPLTMVGRFITTMAMIAGVLVIAMPVSIIGQKFQELYTEEMDLGRLSAYFTKENGHRVKLSLEKLSELHCELGLVEDLLRDLFPRTREVVRKSYTKASFVRQLGGPVKAKQLNSVLAVLETTTIEEVSAMTSWLRNFIEECSLYCDVPMQ
jgi:hypothetical protein